MVANWILKFLILVYCTAQVGTFYESLTGTFSRTSFPEAPPFKAGIAASFPGGTKTWIKYLSDNLNYPLQAEKDKAEAVISVHFTIDTMGNVIDVYTLKDFGYGFSEEVERVIRRSPKWKPAKLDGYKIVYRLVQSVTFQLN